MKKNKDFDLTRLIGKNLIKYFFIAVLLSFIFDVFIIKSYSLHLNNKIIFDDLKVDLKNYKDISEEFLLNHNAGIEVIDNDLMVIYSKGYAKEIKYKYKPTEFTSLINNENLEINVKTLTKTSTEGEYNIILKQQYTKKSLNKFLRISFLAFIIILVGTLTIFLIAFALLLRAIYKPIKTNMDFIRDHIAKTPYDKTKADLSLVNLKEARSVMWSYNHMLDEMEEIKKEKDETIKQSNQLVSNLSHDLKSPITTIKGYSELLLNEDLDQSESLSYIQYINNSSNNLSELVDLLFEQVKFQHSDYSLKFEQDDLNSFLRDIVANHYAIFENKGFNMNIDIEEDKFITNFDKINMNRVFTNLLDNIISHNSKPTDVEIKSRIINDSLLIEIKDNGIGIDPKNKESIFEPFYQVDDSRTNNHSGLGLYLTKQILEKHNSQIDISSSKDYNTIFTIQFPKN